MPEIVAYERVCGIDVAKDSLDLHLIAGVTRTQSFPNSPEGLDRIVKLCQHHQVQIITLEATGGLQRPLAVALAQAQLSVAVINPSRIRFYALAEGLIAKTDKVDARMIAQFTLKLRPKPTLLRSEEQERLTRLVTRKTQLISCKVAEENRLQQETQREVLKSISTHLKFLDRQIASIDALLEQTVQQDPELLAKVEMADSAIGVGRASAIALVVSMPELGTVTGKQAASLAGLAPFNRDSGKVIGERHIFGGRAAIRCTLYMCALSAVRYDPKIRQMYLRLLEAGKCKMKALTACMRKMLVILNAKVRDALAQRAMADSAVATASAATVAA